MKIVKGFLSGLVLFIFGLEIGGFGMWCITINALKRTDRENLTQTMVTCINKQTESLG